MILTSCCSCTCNFLSFSQFFTHMKWLHIPVLLSSVLELIEYDIAGGRSFAIAPRPGEQLKGRYRAAASNGRLSGGIVGEDRAA